MISLHQVNENYKLLELIWNLEIRTYTCMYLIGVQLSSST